jgi:dolichyl-phosphate beta-glucosyltransferase
MMNLSHYFPDRFGSNERRSSDELISLVLPAYNPGPDIVHTFRRIRSFLRNAVQRWEVIFVCDGCADGTPERLEYLNRRAFEPIRVLSYPKNRGKGFAVRTGLAAARGRWRIFTDVDLAYSLRDVERLANVLRAGADVAIASREHPDSEVIAPARLLAYANRRQLQGRAFGWLARRLLPLRQRDMQAGLKGLSAAAAECILPFLGRNGFGFDCELLTACHHFGISVAEVPVRVRFDSPRTSTGWVKALQMVWELFQIRGDWRDGVPATTFTSPAAPLPVDTTHRFASDWPIPRSPSIDCPGPRDRT